MRTPLLLAFAALTACAAPQQAPADEAEREAELNQQALIELRARGAAERAANEAAAAERAVPALPTEVLRPVSGPPALTPAGDLRREAVLAFHARGPHALLGAVEMIPAQRDGSTLGFTLGTIHASGSFITDAGLRSGDIIRRVNGRSIVLPDDFMEVFDSLPDADALTVEVLRGDETIELRWTIVDEG